ncbi:hypothetical protein K3N28_03520 [Glycomyces sp. TRM65418]|uniref:hypothetical protein n=1 Tax=Glycomyces sp. TRM65418 TaxID=2867006 RepID=UPI001CE655F5|nr:hypothetical protein [Glycomyces sp. TRM65418]MCC3762141.1 hypothetical protein [Glycomyces sp. TRM65418]QZD56205.1 hypothetical protein K3N28_03500 [Glycomyces sp. TRM65418]
MPSFRTTATAVAAPVVLVAALAGCGDGADDADDAVDLDESLAATLMVTDTWGGVHPIAGGEADVDADAGTSVSLSAAGLGPGLEYTAHVHDGLCADNPPGGGHWLADPSGEDAPGNIVQLSFTTDADGAGATEVASDLALDDRAKSIVVHVPESEAQAHGSESDRVLCGDLKAA